MNHRSMPVTHTIAAVLSTHTPIKFTDQHTGLDLWSYADIAAPPVDGCHVLVTDGVTCWRCRFRAGVPLPDGIHILAVSRAVVIPE